MNKNLHQQFQDLMQKRMDRKDFIKHVAFGFVALTGAATVIKALNKGSSSQAQKSGAEPMAYGGSVYGGVPKNKS